jgi:ABC-type branched-subunit amino acid transport system ATPase component
VTPSLDVRGVSKRFGGVQALQSVDFVALPGEIHGLIGPNGAGKSTLVGCIAGVLTIDGGEVWCRGERIDGWPVHRRAAAGIGRTFQKIRLAPALSVSENVAIGLAAHPDFRALRAGLSLVALSSPRLAAPVEAALETAGIAHVRAEPVASLPYGQRHFVELARALVAEPSVLLLDEPATGLTEPERARVAALVRKCADSGRSILLVEHDLALVGRLCDRVTVLDSGRRIFTGSPAEAQADAAVVAAYLGSATFAHRGTR